MSLDTATQQTQTRDKSPYRSSDDSLFKELVKKRGIVKGRLTRFANHLVSLKNEPISSKNCIDLKLRIQGANNLFREFNEVQTKIEEIAIDTEEQLSQRDIFEDHFYSTISQAEYILNLNQATDSSEGTRSHKHKSIKLPTISMPTFNGSCEQWLEFRDTFLSLVHNSSELSNIEKFHYLKSSLRESAELVINSVEFSSNNYNVAWELLLHRFNNSRLLIHNHVKSLFTMQCVNKESPVLIRKLIDTVLKNLRSLKILGEPTESWDTLIIYLVVSKLDPTTEREWEQCKGTLLSNANDSKRRLKIDDLIAFLKDRADMLETLQVSHSKSNNESKRNYSQNQSQNKVHCNVSTNKPAERQSRDVTKRLCSLCDANHPLYSCQKFIDTNLESKLKLIHDKKLCINCLRSGHSVESCRFGPCRMCNKKHNSLVHPGSPISSNVLSVASELSPYAHTTTDELQPRAVPTAPESQPAPAPRPQCLSLVTQIPNKIQVNNAHINLQCTQTTVLLSTAVVMIADHSSNYHPARALLDSGSQRCFITKSLCNLLQTPVIQSTQEIRGVGNSVTNTTQTCNIEIQSRTESFVTHIQCFVLPTITSSLPAMTINKAQLNIPQNIQLADPQFYQTKNIDILIGADIFWDLIKTDKMKLASGPFLLDTKLGWIISGPINSFSRKDEHILCNFSQSIESQLRQFWELEEVPRECRDTRTEEELACEEHFLKNTTRNIDGRFCVRIPFKKDPALLGESYPQAERRFLALEKRLHRNSSYKQLYSDFIHEYLRLGHMSRVERYGSSHFFLPHHGVFREQSITTKLRVVFDASAASSNNVSLNELQMVGPAIQGDLLAILLRFRIHKYTACADVEKMYRQCLIHEDQRDYQLILWRDDPSEPIGIYRLNTVTYGTASAPFLSCRCLKQLAIECNDPDVTRVINQDMYVDDMITSCENKEELLTICYKTEKVLSAGCFPLRKWKFNFNYDDPALKQSDSFKSLSLIDNTSSKTLGLGWCNANDEFHFSTQLTNDNKIITKRYMMSHISQIFDPLGLLSPFIITAKILLQKLWLLKIGWDDQVPTAIEREWNRFASSVPYLNNIRTPRHAVGSNPARRELHVFCDASECAYGACVYIRTINNDSSVTVRLYYSKGKVAPLKPVSIPRLELCGALLGARLYRQINESLNFQFDNIMFWSDSTIVLGWLKMAPNLLKTFVQNRVAEIHEITKDLPWCHVSGKNNPADLVSRGHKLEDLASSSLWWEGPEFLHDRDFNCNNVTSHQNSVSQYTELPEVKPVRSVNMLIASTDTSVFSFERFSNYNRLKRTCAYVLRFIKNIRNKNNKINGVLTVDELRAADTTLIRLSQKESFPEEYKILQNKGQLKNKHDLIKLNIFLDSDNVLRVGGRIKHSPSFSFDKKHPIVLSSKHWLSMLLFRHEHRRLQHAGPQALLYNTREAYWVIGGRNLAKLTVHKCIICKRLRGKTLSPIMGDLPEHRITPTFPFLHCGVDYAGPVMVLNRKGRGSKLIKSYICLFVCFVTRAIHLELVSDLSADAYLLALKRFIARRGKPAEIVSDNGRNFVGLANEFSKFITNCSKDIIEYATNENIKFRFVPPYAPHFAGLSEAGVKSCKHHMLRVIGNAHLTFEEFNTILTQIESILNSRPLNPMSTDPNDLLPLSPAHFLVGRLLTAPATEPLTAVPVHRLTRYQRLEQIRQHFWTRWSKEYVSELQTRTKWREQKTDLQTGTMVVIKEDNTPPLRWKLGRIISTRPGKDGVSRVADIRTTSGVIRRAFPRICPLFDDHE